MSSTHLSDRITQISCRSLKGLLYIAVVLIIVRTNKPLS